VRENSVPVKGRLPSGAWIGAVLRETEENIVNPSFRWGALAVALMVLAGSVSQTQAQAQVPATKVGVVNIGLLFTKYNKAQIMKKEIEGDLAPLKADAEKLKTIIQQHQEWLKKYATQDPAQKEKSEKAIRDATRALEDLDMQARKLIGKKQEAQLIQLYKEVHAAVQSYGQQNGYHIILAFGAPAEADPFAFPSVNRWMNAMDIGSVVPFYVQTGLDVSNDVLARLNATVPAQPVGLQK